MVHHIRAFSSAFAAVVVLAHGSIAAAIVVPGGFAATPFATPPSSPTAMDFAPDGRLFVTGQGGTIRRYNANGTTQASSTFLVSSFGDRGLLGLAFDPDYVTNRYIYVHYTANSAQPHGRISRFTTQTTGSLLVAGSELELFQMDILQGFNGLHNGGALHLGPDNKLYVGTGDDQDGNNSQSLATTHGKMLRLNLDGSAPADNPFVSQTSGIHQAIWAMGLRNPFTFALHPTSGRMFINDVGSGGFGFSTTAFEEINEGIAGANYGWPATEGYTSNPAYSSPVYAYVQNDGSAIVGGAFYETATPLLGSGYLGKYFFADLVRGQVNVFDPATGGMSLFASGVSGARDVKVGPDGALYVLGSSEVTRIIAPEPVMIPALTLVPLLLRRRRIQGALS